MIFSLNLDANEDQLDFPVVYASGINGTASVDPEKQDENMQALYDMILEKIPAPIDNREEPLQFQVALLDYNELCRENWDWTCFPWNNQSRSTSSFNEI